jgi:hypothetical protein
MREKSFSQDVNCSWATCILLASKGKGHKPVEIVCVRWLPSMLYDKHIKSYVGVHPNWCCFHSPILVSNEPMTLLVDYDCPLPYEQ